MVTLIGSWLMIACSNGGVEPETHPGPSNAADVADVIYEPGTTDEGVLTLLDALPVSDPRNEPVVIAPSDQATLAERTVFTLAVGPSASRGHARPAARIRWIGDFLTLEGVAHAHGASMNGDAFLLVFSTKTHGKLLRVFTQERAYAPTVSEWQRLADAHEVVTLTVTRATFEAGRLTEDGGPFVGKPLRFTIAS